MKKLLQMSVSIFTSCIRFLLSMEFLEELTLVVYSENFEHKEEIADEIVNHIIKQDKHLVKVGCISTKVGQQRKENGFVKQSSDQELLQNTLLGHKLDTLTSTPVGPVKPLDWTEDWAGVGLSKKPGV